MARREPTSGSTLSVAVGKGQAKGSRAFPREPAGALRPGPRRDEGLEKGEAEE